MEEEDLTRASEASVGTASEVCSVVEQEDLAGVVRPLDIQAGEANRSVQALHARVASLLLNNHYIS